MVFMGFTGAPHSLSRDAKCLREASRGGRDRPALILVALEAALTSGSNLVSWTSASSSIPLTTGPLTTLTDYLSEVRVLA